MDSLKRFETSIKGKNRIPFDHRDVIVSAGNFKRLEGINVYIDSIRNLLCTPLGTYPFMPEYGSLLYKMVFEPLDDISLEQITYECKDRIVMFDQRINIESVKVKTISDNKGVSVDIVIRKGPEIGTVKINFKDVPQMGLD